MTTQITLTMNDIAVGTLFICAGVGVLRKTHPCQGTSKTGKTHVIYPNEVVRLLSKKGDKA